MIKNIQGIIKLVYFIVKDLKAGSTLLRAYQIKDTLLKYYNSDFQVIDINMVSLLKEKENCIFIWIGAIEYKYINLLSKKNINILDIVDKYLYNKKIIETGLNNNLYQIVIVNNNYMKNYFKRNTKFNGEIFVIYHHWDPRLSLTTTDTDNKLIFGYMGSIKSLLHTDNFLHYKKLIRLYPIIFFDTEIGMCVTDKVINNNINYSVRYNCNNMPEYLSFNCDINIREKNSIVSKFKTTAKLATAAVLGHNIITTMDEAIKDVLPADYPFILENSDFDTVNNMFQLVINDYNKDKVLWNKGLTILKNIKDKLALDTVINDYIRLLNTTFIM